jgi:hypothetical protein
MKSYRIVGGRRSVSVIEAVKHGSMFLEGLRGAGALAREL